MFLLKAVGNLVFGQAEGTEASLPSGKLFYLDPSSTESKKLIYTDANIVVKSTSTPFNFELLISKSEEADNYAEDNELNDFEASFLIDAQLLFKRDHYKLVWADVEDESGICGWEFVVDSTIPGTNVDLFEEAVYYSMLRRQLRKDKDDITPNEYRNFVLAYKERVAQSSVGVWKATPTKPAVKVSPLKPAQVSSPKQPVNLTPPDMSTVQAKVRQMLKPVEVENGEVLIKMDCELWIYDVVSTTFIECFPRVQVELRKSLEEDFKYEFVVYVDGVASIVQELRNDIYPFFDSQQLAFIWNTISENPISWSIKFAKEDASTYHEFNHWFSNSLYEATNKTLFSKAKKIEQDFIQEMFEDMEIDDRESNEEEEDEEEEEDATVVKQERENPFNDNSENSLLAVGYKHNRSFVVRGNKIGVFKHGEEDDLEFATTINNIGTMSGEFFSPKKVMLHQQDSSLLMMKPNDSKNVYKMDLETGKVVEEWNVHEHMAVTEIAPEAKYSQLTNEQTILGINPKSMFKIDPRLSGSKIVMDNSKVYSSNLRFSTIATTGDGKVVIGSDKGEIRLFDKIGKIAKTCLPGLGDPIIGLDTTEHGEYILATCKTYLLLIETTKKGETKSAFEKSIKPAPRRLTLKPEHAAWLGPNISFTPAKFNAEQGGKEKRIITSTGKFIISWNFREIKLGKYYNYTIKEYSENVVADNFKYGQDRDIIVALPSNVEMVKKNHLSTPVKLLKSRSEVQLKMSEFKEPQNDEEMEFEALKPSELASGKSTSRRIPIPPHRLTPLKKDWLKIYTPLVEHLKLQIRMNLKKKSIDLKTSEETEDIGAIQKAADFIKAYNLGFDINDAISLLRLDDLYIDTFEIKDVKTLSGDNLSRAIGRIVGKDGKTKFTIENTSRTRIVVADTKIHILGSFQNIKIARDAIVHLILGSSPGKVYSKLRTISTRMKERF